MRQRSTLRASERYARPVMPKINLSVKTNACFCTQKTQATGESTKTSHSQKTQ
jgi:hypothetical protein